MELDLLSKGQKIETPFDGGIAGKIYFSAYMKPRTGYQLAKQVFGTKENSSQPKTPSKIYKYVKKHPDYFDFPDERKGKRYEIDVELDPLIKKIFSVLRGNEWKRLESLEYSKHDLSGQKAKKELESFLREYLDKDFRDFLRSGYRVVPRGNIEKIEPYDPKNVFEKPIEEIARGLLGIIEPVEGAIFTLKELGEKKSEKIEKGKAKRYLIELFCHAVFYDIEPEKAMSWFELPLKQKIPVLSLAEFILKANLGFSGKIASDHFGNEDLLIKSDMEMMKTWIKQSANDDDKNRIEKAELKLRNARRKALENQLKS